MSDTPEDLDAAVEQLTCASLVDAMGRIHGHRAHLLSMVSPTPDRRLFGPAATIAYLPYRDDLPQTEISFADLFQQAVGEAPVGRVLVLSNGGYPDASHGGGMKLSRLERDGLAGVLADGRLRDFEQLGSYEFATWCRGEATRWGGDTVMPYATDVAVEVAGVCVAPGDYVYADASGAVVIPAASLSRVLDEAHTIENDDAATIAAILPMRVTCEHLQQLAPVEPTTPNGCKECLAIGQRWVHLRMCMDCGHVGCCDSSPGRHATGHASSTGHPVVQSFEPGEDWAFCYPDEAMIDHVDGPLARSVTA